MTSESSKLNSYHKPKSVGFIACINTSPIFFAVSLQRSEHADVVCWFYNNIVCFKLAFSKPRLRASKRKTDCVIMTSFLWSILKRFKRRATAMLNSINKLEIHWIILEVVFFYCFWQERLYSTSETKIAVVVLRSKQLSPAESWRLKHASCTIVVGQTLLCYCRLHYTLLTGSNQGKKYNIFIYHTPYL